MAKNAIIEDIEDLQNDVIDLTKEINDLKERIITPDDLKTSIEEFLNLANNGENKMRAGTSVEKDILARTLLLNIEIDNKKSPFPSGTSSLRLYLNYFLSILVRAKGLEPSRA